MYRPNVRILRSALVVPKGFAAITLGRFIFVHPDYRLTESLLAHELRHVRQWQKYGVIGFLLRYGWSWLREGFSYHRIDLEEDARGVTPADRVWARDLLEKENA